MPDRSVGPTRGALGHRWIHREKPVQQPDPMNRSERRLMIDTTVLGVLLTLIVCAIDFAGGLFRVEQLAYDLRAQYFQNFTPPPTTQLVHVDIDDESLTEIGHWPWPRQTMAQLIDEIRLAGA